MPYCFLYKYDVYNMKLTHLSELAELGGSKRNGFVAIANISLAVNNLELSGNENFFIYSVVYITKHIFSEKSVLNACVNLYKPSRKSLFLSLFDLYIFNHALVVEVFLRTTVISYILLKLNQ